MTVQTGNRRKVIDFNSSTNTLILNRIFSAFVFYMRGEQWFIAYNNTAHANHQFVTLIVFFCSLYSLPGCIRSFFFTVTKQSSHTQSPNHQQISHKPNIIISTTTNNKNASNICPTAFVPMAFNSSCISTCF